eukprot:GHUV01051299.1.p1 GENE.GHUV01051299.1~~GHUV01051299.1.p1  ORF type:complete len:102 (+),score=20.72 GHUV01051299.1:150-455(+)
MATGFGRSVTSSPAAFAAATSAASLLPDGSAAMMRISGLMALAAMAMPDNIPPPLTGTTITSSSGTCSSSASDHKMFPHWSELPQCCQHESTRALTVAAAA